MLGFILQSDIKQKTYTVSPKWLLEMGNNNCVEDIGNRS